MRNYQDYLIEKLKDTEYAEGYLNASLEAFMEDNDTKALLLALEHLARAKYSITDLAKHAGISRQHIYRIFDDESNPNFKTISTIIKSLGFTLKVQTNRQAA